MNLVGQPLKLQKNKSRIKRKAGAQWPAFLYYIGGE